MQYKLLTSGDIYFRIMELFYKTFHLETPRSAYSNDKIGVCGNCTQLHLKVFHGLDCYYEITGKMKCGHFSENVVDNGL